MYRNGFALALLVCGAAAASQPYTQADPAELQRAVPELAGIQFDLNQAPLDALLKSSGENLRTMLTRMVDVSAAEDIHEMRFEAGKRNMSRREDFRYVVKWVPHAAQERFTEFRIDAPPPNGDFLVTGQFFSLLRYLLPENRPHFDFRYLGRATAADQFIVAFAQRPETAAPGAARVQGIVWLDAATHRIVRLRTDFLEKPTNSPFESLTTDMSLVPVTFPYMERTFWLPATVDVHAHYPGGDVDSIHRFSAYFLYDEDAGPALEPKYAGVAPAAAPAPENIWEQRLTSELASANTPARDELPAAPTPKVASPAAAVPPQANIKVEVRQVLVPVIVRDKEGHHVTGLTQSDFHLFEDGVEQKISGFSVENAGAPARAPATAAAQQAATPAAPATPPQKIHVRRTYLICIDALHTSFSHLVYVREALAKIFSNEAPGDAEYIVISIGLPTHVLQQPTTNPQAVLKLVDSKDFQKLFLGSRKSSIEDDLRSFRRDLDDARTACDTGDVSCRSRKARLPSQAEELTQQDRQYTMVFLTEFRSLIDHLRRGTGRRTMILFSDGFQLVPGQLAWQLLHEYFPDIFGSTLRTVDRMPDLEPLLQLAANSNIPVYTIDSRGLYAPPFADASNSGGVPRLMPAVVSATNQNATEAGQTLREIADATGGTAYQNSNDLFSGLQRAFADGRQYYVLAYVSSNTGLDGKFRAISVRLKDPKLEVNAKRGYWAVATPN